jgi:hypothetical protein
VKHRSKKNTVKRCAKHRETPCEKKPRETSCKNLVKLRAKKNTVKRCAKHRETPCEKKPREKSYKKHRETP